MDRRFHVTVEGKAYEAVAVVAAHPGRAVVVSLMAGGAEVGSVKMTASLPLWALRFAGFSDAEFLDAACEQFRNRALASRALQSTVRPLVFELV